MHNTDRRTCLVRMLHVAAVQQQLTVQKAGALRRHARVWKAPSHGQACLCCLCMNTSNILVQNRKVLAPDSAAVKSCCQDMGAQGVMSRGSALLGMRQHSWLPAQLCALRGQYLGTSVAARVLSDVTVCSSPRYLFVPHVARGMCQGTCWSQWACSGTEAGTAPSVCCHHWVLVKSLTTTSQRKQGERGKNTCSK